MHAASLLNVSSGIPVINLVAYFAGVGFFRQLQNFKAVVFLYKHFEESETLRMKNESHNARFLLTINYLSLQRSFSNLPDVHLVALLEVSILNPTKIGLDEFLCINVAKSSLRNMLSH